MYELSQAAAQDIEAILDRSIIDFGPIQTERYFASLNRCLGLLGENPGMGSAADEIRPVVLPQEKQETLIFLRYSRTSTSPWPSLQMTGNWYTAREISS